MTLSNGLLQSICKINLIFCKEWPARHSKRLIDIIKLLDIDHIILQSIALPDDSRMHFGFMAIFYVFTIL